MANKDTNDHSNSNCKRYDLGIKKCFRTSKNSYNKSSFNLNLSPQLKCSVITMSAEIQFAHQDHGLE